MHIKTSAGIMVGITVFLAGIGTLLLLPSLANGQVWVPPSGQISVDLSYQYMDVGDHLFSRPLAPELSGNGTDSQDRGQILGQTGILGLDFGINDRLAASASVAFVASKYNGERPENEIDDGRWNQGLQDISIGLRYMTVRAPVFVTPSIAVNIPTRSYETLGHASIGRDLNEIQLGLSLGWVGRSFVPGLFLQGTYAFSLTEKVDGFQPNRTDVGLEAGYFLTQDLVLWARGAYTHTHSGIDWVDLLEEEVSEEVHHEHLLSHDRYAKKVATTAGGGLSYAFGPTALGLGVLTTLSGENTHDATVFIFSVSRTFNLVR